MKTYSIGRTASAVMPTTDQALGIADSIVDVLDQWAHVAFVAEHARTDKGRRALANLRRKERQMIALARLLAARRGSIERPALRPQLVSVTASPNGPNALPASAVGVAA